MIKINVVGELSDLSKAFLQYHKEHFAKSYSERNPEIGKMVNCSHPGCAHPHRHRASLKHDDLVYSTPRYELDEETGLPKAEDEKRILIAPPTRNGIVGAAAFKGKRIRPHLHPRTLEAKQRTDDMFAEDVAFAESLPAPNFQPDITQCVREAIKCINNRIRKAAKKARKQAQLSRRINLGLAVPGSRL
jgi:hypothetical protein